MAIRERENVSGRDAGPSPSLCQACHDLIDAASSLMLNVDYLAQGGEDSKLLGAATDARLSVERIVEIANALRAAPSKPVAFDAAPVGDDEPIPEANAFAGCAKDGVLPGGRDRSAGGAWSGPRR
jgi:hypothetical protein